jgi:glycosyltransferase involved in cell wall biosynthesis
MKNKKTFSMEQLRQIAWDLGQYFPEGPTGDFLAFTPIRTGLAYLNWSMLDSSVEDLQAAEGERFDGAVQVLRIYDVSLIEFDGSNAHSFFDVEVDGLVGHYYLHSEQIERTLLAETGFRLRDGGWRAIARSVPVFMDRNYRAGHAEPSGLYVAGGFDRVFPVENIYHAPVFERAHQLWRQTGGSEYRVDVDIFETEAEQEARLRAYLDSIHAPLGKFGIRIAKNGSADLIHQHGVSSQGKVARKKGSVPQILSLRTTERQRAEMNGREPDAVILEQEHAAMEASDLVIVPYDEMREHFMAEFGLSEDRVAILPDLFESAVPQRFDPGEVKKSYHLNPARPLVLFASEISHAAGADLLAGAIEHVGGGNHEVQFVFVGEGPLKGELEGRFHHNKMGERVRFTGDLWHGAFQELLAACEFVIIPARTWQDEALAHAALEAGKPVIATHQSRIHCIQHGENGFMVYDNPGSIIWGLQEMLTNPFQSGPGGIIRRPTYDQQTHESLAAELSVLYRRVLAGREVNRG